MNVKRVFACICACASLAAYAGDISLDEFDAEVERLPVDEPTEQDPLSMNATLVAADPGHGDPVIAVLKLKMAPGWYIYADVPDSQPFIETDWILNADPSLEIIDDWAGPPSTRHKDISSIRIHEAGRDGSVFFRELEVVAPGEGSASVEIGLRYQVCNPEFCLPPKTKTRTVSVDVAAD
ncbi:MAG: protein-disulfide reductase DsbD N-terminal domain-containing protein [Gammaproteobacteria bacterium]|nr:protein-disulfide reductase DsbD N-terminal domain-containing protein [Gammaproteobacteria bacterium]MDH5619834.1 protein-disulfide reductase DsbD N-terminal domain-containing protein [Gammaproteobacteria bacterium]